MKNYLIFFLFVLLIPLFWLNVTGLHDWGDDFAQNISHAQNIVNGTDYNKTGYIYNPENRLIGPPNYPLGFPLLISPVVLFFNSNIYALQLYITAWLVLFSVLLFVYLKLFTAPAWSFLLTIFVAYSHWMLDFKDEIMSDLPFAVIILILLIVLRQKNKKYFLNIILLVFLASFAILTKDSGYFILLAFFIALIFSLLKIKFKQYEPFQEIPILFKISLVGLIFLIPYSIKHWLLVIPSTDSYFQIWQWNDILLVISKNLNYYSEVFMYFFQPYTLNLSFLTLWLSAFAISFVLIGFLRRLMVSFGLIDLLFLCYLAMILTYPYVGSGFRFLLPLIPFLLIYLIEGVKSINFPIKIKWYLSFSILMLVFVSINWYSISNLFQNKLPFVEGPQQPEALEIFERINKLTDNQSNIMFIKPRVLALYSNRNSIGDVSGSQDVIVKTIREYKVNYILIHHKYSKNDVINYAKNWNIVFSNELFTLYKIPKN